MASVSLRRRLLAAALVCLPLVLPADGGAQSRAPGVLDEDSPEVVDLTITGVRAVEEDQLRRAIQIDESRCRSLVYRFTLCPFYKGDVVYRRAYLDREEFRRDVLRIKLFYYERGYREAQVDTAVVRSGRDRVRVLLAVQEGEPTRVDTVVVERAGGLIARRRRERLLRIRKGDPLDLLRIDSVKVAIRDALGGRGYADAEVGTRVEVDDAARLARVTIAVDPKRRTTIDTIVVRGNQRVSTETIRNSLRIKEGDPFRLSDVAESQRTLYESGLFRRADISAAPATDTTRPQRDSAKTLVVTLQEALPRAARTSAGFNTFEFFQVGGRYTNYNLLGGARRLDVQGAVGNLGAEQLNQRFIFRNPQLITANEDRYFAPTYQTSFDVTQRWFGDPRNTLSAGVFAQRRSSPLVFVDRGYGATATFTREFGARVPVSLNYRFEVSGVEAGDVYFCVNFGVCEQATIGALSAQQRLSPLALSASADRANDLFSPTRGFRVRGDAEYASQYTASDFRYNRGSVQASYYLPRFGGVVATRLRAGGVQSLGGTAEATGVGSLDDAALIHPRKRFYAGGSQSVRGYGENQLGPRVLTIPRDVLRGRFVRSDGTVGYRFCDPVTTPSRNCDPNAVVVGGDNMRDTFRLTDADFIPRPVGGDAVLEGSLEYRFSLARRYNLSGAVFVDAAVVTGQSVLGRETVAAATPGFGVRYRSPVGPIRVDFGLNPSLPEDLRVITESDSSQADDRELVQLQGTVNPDGSVAVSPRRTFAAYRRGGRVGSALGRLVLHLSIGEAF